jgi:uncharacterized membrane protein YeiH
VGPHRTWSGNGGVRHPIGLIAVVSVVIITALGGTVRDIFTNANTQV